MKQFKLLNYEVYLLEYKEECEYIKTHLPNITIAAFDTETNTPIDMAKRKDSNLIDIKNDRPFLIQFGYDNIIFICDIENKNIEFIRGVLDLFNSICKKSKLVIGHNIKFDIHMLMNIGYEFHTNNLCDSMSIARLSLESKSEREGGYSMALKPLAARLLGTHYADAGKTIDIDLQRLWSIKLKDLNCKLKPFKISRVIINNLLKDPTGTLDILPIEVQNIWNTWKASSMVSYKDVNRELLYKYGACDVILVLELTKLLLPIVNDKNQLQVLKREMQLIMPLVRMERTGYTVDKKYLITCKQALIFEINQIKSRNKEIIGKDISPNQHKEIKEQIALKFNYTLESTDKNQMHIAILTDKNMPKLVAEYLQNVIYLRTLLKWITTYIDPMLYRLNLHGDTKVYTMYNPNGAVSGRFTSNFQQFPKNPIYSKFGNFELFHPRKMFVCDKDFPEMAYIDYSQVELRLQAEYTYYCTKGYGDVNMLRAYMPFKCHKIDNIWYQDDDNKEWKGIDLHTQSTHMAFPNVKLDSDEFKKLRSIGKRVNFALIYGSGLATVQNTLADTDPEIVKKLYNGFHSRFKDVATYSNWVKQIWSINGGYVTNLMGRRYYMKNSSEVYKLNNYLIQGSAADIIKTVIINVDKMLQKGHYKTKLQGCIHDELCICVAEGEHDLIYKIKDIMEHTVKTFVPLVAEIEITNTNWAEKHEE